MVTLPRNEINELAARQCFHFRISNFHIFHSYIRASYDVHEQLLFNGGATRIEAGNVLIQ